jgi:hypothetical protein
MRNHIESKKISDRYIIRLANDMYGKNTLQADAFRHILAAAYYTIKIGAFAAMFGGYLVEILGSFKSMIKLHGISSGWRMDIRNNNIGIEIGKKNKYASFNELVDKTKNIIDEGIYYMPSGSLFRDEKK